jgi:hypothetical protein
VNTVPGLFHKYYTSLNEPGGKNALAYFVAVKKKKKFFESDTRSGANVKFFYGCNLRMLA